MPRSLRALVCIAALALLPTVPAARAAMLEDSTRADAWRLANGLEVRIRDVPGAKAVAITLAYRAGRWIEPDGLPGLASVLAQVQFTAPVDNVPERPLAEMNSIRPLGWGVVTNPHLSVLTEVGSAEHLAGVLHEVARRAHGVRVTDSCLTRVVRGVRREAAERRFGKLETALYERVGDQARGLGDSEVLEVARGTGLASLTTARVDSLLRRYYGASNVAVALVGDFGGVDLRPLVEHEFGDIPAGTPQPDPPLESLSSSTRISTVVGLQGRAGAMGILAPPLDDDRHATFYLFSLVLGGWWNRNHEKGSAPLSSHFQFSLFDEPELARFEFDLKPGPVESQRELAEWNDSMDDFAQTVMTGDIPEMFRTSIRWLLGGPLSRAQRLQAATTASFISTIASTTATRAAWKGDAFWAGYRDRFENARFTPPSFFEWLTAPEHQVLLLLQSRR